MSTCYCFRLNKYTVVLWAKAAPCLKYLFYILEPKSTKAVHQAKGHRWRLFSSCWPLPYCNQQSACSPCVWSHLCALTRARVHVCVCYFLNALKQQYFSYIKRREKQYSYRPFCKQLAVFFLKYVYKDSWPHWHHKNHNNKSFSVLIELVFPFITEINSNVYENIIKAQS